MKTPANFDCRKQMNNKMEFGNNHVTFTFKNKKYEDWTSIFIDELANSFVVFP